MKKTTTTTDKWIDVYLVLLLSYSFYIPSHPLAISMYVYSQLSPAFTPMCSLPSTTSKETRLALDFVF